MFYLLSSLVFANVPQIVLDGDRNQKSVFLENPIHRVTLYSDRSLVERKVSTKLSKGTHIIQFSDISGSAYKDSIRIQAEGGQIYRVEKELVKRSDYDLEELQNMIVKMENLQDTRKQLTQERNRYRDENF